METGKRKYRIDRCIVVRASQGSGLGMKRWKKKSHMAVCIAAPAFQAERGSMESIRINPCKGGIVFPVLVNKDYFMEEENPLMIKRLVVVIIEWPRIMGKRKSKKSE